MVKRGLKVVCIRIPTRPMMRFHRQETHRVATLLNELEAQILGIQIPFAQGIKTQLPRLKGVSMDKEAATIKVFGSRAQEPRVRQGRTIHMKPPPIAIGIGNHTKGQNHRLE
jgi:hypothetical protein